MSENAVKEWLNWEVVNPERINGRRVSIRWAGYFDAHSEIHEGQIRLEDGRIVDFMKKSKMSYVMLSSGQNLGDGVSWVECLGKRYDDVFDLILARHSS